jgi:hypothetical protein
MHGIQYTVLPASAGWEWFIWGFSLVGNFQEVKNVEDKRFNPINDRIRRNCASFWGEFALAETYDRFIPWRRNCFRSGTFCSGHRYCTVRLSSVLLLSSTIQRQN